MAQQPELVGYYSRNRVVEYLPDSSRLTYYKPPRNEDVYFDLNRGIESAVRRNYSSGDKRFLFKWIEYNHEGIEAAPGTGRWLEPNFLCSWGVLSMLLCSSAPKMNWAIRAAKWRGSIFLTLGHRTHSFYTRKSEEEQQKIASWLYKFERHVVSDRADQEPDPSKAVIEPDEFKCVYKTQFGAHSVLYDAPMKAVRSEEQLVDPLPLEDLQFALLRLELQRGPITNQLPRHKLIKWWSLAYLTNTEEILCGFRNESGIVRKVRRYTLQEIVEEAEFHFHPLSCIEYCKSILSSIAENVVDDETVFEFEKVPYVSELLIREMPEQMLYDMIPSYFRELHE